MLGVRVEILRWVDDSQPGWVECRLVDARGRAWLFVEKAPVVTLEDLGRSSVYPRPGFIACQIVARTEADGSEAVAIDTELPWHVEARSGETRFVVLPEQLVGCHVEVPSSIAACDPVSALGRCHPALALAVETSRAEWHPEAVPTTVALGVLGRTLVESAAGFRESDIERIATAVEGILSVGGAPADAVATGFIEAICNLSARHPGEVRRVVEHLGASARDYIRAWDLFTGIQTPENPA